MSCWVRPWGLGASNLHTAMLLGNDGTHVGDALGSFGYIAEDIVATQHARMCMKRRWLSEEQYECVARAGIEFMS